MLMKNKFLSYPDYAKYMLDVGELSASASLLQWDQEVNLCSGGVSSRARQISTLSGIIHERITDDEFFSFIKILQGDKTLSKTEKSNVRVTLRDIERKRKYPKDFVETLSETSSYAFMAWDKARKENDFGLYAPWLSKILDLKKREADFIGFETHPYDALLDEFEPGMHVKYLDSLFDSLIPPLEKLIDAISAKNPPEKTFLNQVFEKDAQWNFTMDLLKKIGFDFTRGRQDISSHPFTIHLGEGDVRITTRIDENNISESVWSSIHEAGHALYEQGLDLLGYSLPAGEAASLGIHESQSRLWENQVGRSYAFWEFFLPFLRKYFPHQLANVSLETFYGAINHVKPGLIRTNADELTYHFHIKIRYEAEKELITGNLAVRDLPDYWNEKYLRYLKINVKDHKTGVLQDVHWSHGSIGYFPTYTLGSLYAAQIYEACLSQTENLESDISGGNFMMLQHWLQNAVYRHGRHKYSNEICEMATGKPLSIDSFLKYATSKYNSIYNL